MIQFVLLFVVSTAVAGATESQGAAHMRAVRNAASQVLSRSARTQTNAVTFGGRIYYTYASCTAAVNAAIDYDRQLVASGTASNANADDINTMLATVDTCPIGIAPIICARLSDTCISVYSNFEHLASLNGGNSLFERQTIVEGMCSKANMACISYILSLMATIATNPTSCSWYHSLSSSKPGDSCTFGIPSFSGPRLGNNNVSVDYGNFACLTCPVGKEIRITDVFYGLRDPTGHAICSSNTAQDTIEDSCEHKSTCSVNTSGVYTAIVPAAGASRLGQTCSGMNASLEIQFTCVTPSSVYSDLEYIQNIGDRYDEYACVRDTNGQLCGVWDFEVQATYGNMSYHGGHLSAEQCQGIRDSGSCCWASSIDFESQIHPSTDPDARRHVQSIIDTAISSCAEHNIPIAPVLGSWERQDEHCGTPASISGGTGGFTAEHSVDVSTNAVTGSSGSNLLAPSMLLTVLLAAMSM